MIGRPRSLAFGDLEAEYHLRGGSDSNQTASRPATQSSGNLSRNCRIVWQLIVPNRRTQQDLTSTGVQLQAFPRMTMRIDLSKPVAGFRLQDEQNPAWVSLQRRHQPAEVIRAVRHNAPVAAVLASRVDEESASALRSAKRIDQWRRIPHVRIVPYRANLVPPRRNGPAVDIMRRFDLSFRLQSSGVGVVCG